MSIAPLGVPVVPPVYCSAAMSRSGSMVTWLCRERASAISRWKDSGGTGRSSGSGVVSSARLSWIRRSGSHSASLLAAGRYSVSEVTITCSTAVPWHAASTVSKTRLKTMTALAPLSASWVCSSAAV